MKIQTEVKLEEVTVEIRTNDPDVIAEVEKVPGARVVDAGDERVFEISRESLHVHLPHRDRAA